MTRQDYILIADALRTSREHLEKNFTREHVAGVLSTAHEIAERLESDNPRFNKCHFLAVVRGDKSLTSRPSRNGRQS